MNKWFKNINKKTIITLGSVIVLGGAIALFVTGEGTTTPLTQSLPMSETKQAEWMESFREDLLDERVPYVQAEEDFNNTVERLDDETKDTAVNIFVYRSEERAAQLNALVSVLGEDIEAFDNREAGDDTLSDTFIDSIADPAVKGVLSTIKESNFKLKRDDDGYYKVVYDFEHLLENHGEGLSIHVTSAAKLGVHENNHTYYNMSEGYALFDQMYDRYQLMNELIEEAEEAGEENAWLEGEAYEWYAYMLGAGDYGMNTEEGGYNEQAIKEMEKVIDAHPNEPIAKDMKQIIAHMKEEGHYSEETELLAYELRDTEYKEFIDRFSEELNESKELSESEVEE